MGEMLPTGWLSQKPLRNGYASKSPYALSAEIFLSAFAARAWTGLGKSFSTSESGMQSAAEATESPSRYVLHMCQNLDACKGDRWKLIPIDDRGEV